MLESDLADTETGQIGGVLVSRRLGQAGSANWSNMLDAAERILCEEGYAALTSRRVAERAGFKQRLVYYYFRTMDDLAVETFRRIAARELARLQAAAVSATPVRDFWRIASETSDPRLIAEFMALANRNDALKAEVIAFVQTSRCMQVAALGKAMDKDGRSAHAPDALVVLATSLALALNRESALGLEAGHEHARALIAAFIDNIEPAAEAGRAAR